MKTLLYRGVSEELHVKLNGELRPKKCHIFSSSPKWDISQWDKVYWEESERNAVIEHQQNQVGYPTSGISTTPHIERAKFYATHGGKYSTGYIYVIDRAQCEELGIKVFIVNEVVPLPSVVIDDEVILVAKDFGVLPHSIIIEILKIDA
jgi:hypothetical protein